MAEKSDDGTERFSSTKQVYRQHGHFVPESRLQTSQSLQSISRIDGNKGNWPRTKEATKKKNFSSLFSRDPFEVRLFAVETCPGPCISLQNNQYVASTYSIAFLSEEHKENGAKNSPVALPNNNKSWKKMIFTLKHFAGRARTNFVLYRFYNTRFTKLNCFLHVLNRL